MRYTVPYIIMCASCICVQIRDNGFHGHSFIFFLVFTLHSPPHPLWCSLFSFIKIISSPFSVGYLRWWESVYMVHKLHKVLCWDYETSTILFEYAYLNIRVRINLSKFDLERNLGKKFRNHERYENLFGFFTTVVDGLTFYDVCQWCSYSYLKTSVQKIYLF